MVQWFIWNLERFSGTGSGVFLVRINQVNEKLFLFKLLSRQHLSLRLEPASDFWGLENIQWMRPHGKSESWDPGSIWCDSTPEVPREFFRIKSWRIRGVIERLSSRIFLNLTFLSVEYSCRNGHWFNWDLLKTLGKTALDSASHHW
jgi:hypothetical protein